MAQRWRAGAVVRKSLDDGHTTGRLLKKPWAAFYDFRTEEPDDDLERIVDHPALFTVATPTRLLSPGKWGDWEMIGSLPLGDEPSPPREQFMQDKLDPSQIRIIDDQGAIRDATFAEAEGLESAAVWDTVHIDDRLKDHYAGRPNKWLESMKLKR